LSLRLADNAGSSIMSLRLAEKRGLILLRTDPLRC
jgi:hypothetical protein